MNHEKIRKNSKTLLEPYHFLGLEVYGDVSFVSWLAKEEKALERMNVHSCNEGRTKGGQTRYENRCKNTISSIEDAMPKLKGCVFITETLGGAAIKIDNTAEIGGHNSRHGCIPNPVVAEMICDSGITQDWGGYGMLAPQHQ